MSAAFWRGLFELRDEVDRVARAAARALVEAHAEGESTSRSALVLSSLHVEVRQAVDGFAGALEVFFGRFEAIWAVDRALRLVSFWLNERIRGMLPPRDRADWEPVGPPDVDLRNGGRLFFLDVDRITSELQGSSLRAVSGSGAATRVLADIALFCLEQGFTGEHAESTGALQKYRERLRRPVVRSFAPAPEGAAPNPLHFAPMIAAGLGVCLAFYVLCAAVMGWVGGG